MNGVNNHFSGKRLEELKSLKLRKFNLKLMSLMIMINTLLKAQKEKAKSMSPFSVGARKEFNFLLWEFRILFKLLFEIGPSLIVPGDPSGLSKGKNHKSVQVINRDWFKVHFCQHTRPEGTWSICICFVPRSYARMMYCKCTHGPTWKHLEHLEGVFLNFYCFSHFLSNADFK